MGNILLMLVKIGNVKILLGSVYGPNEDNAEFFQMLTTQIATMHSDYVIIGGDWNTTLGGRVGVNNTMYKL
jgi:hypothetical protein